MSNHRLYELPQLIEDAEDYMINPETGELLEADELKAYLDGLQMELKDKIKYFAQDVANLGVEIEAMKSQKKKLDSRIKANEKRMEWIKGYIRASLNGEKFKAEDGSISVSYRNTKDVVTVTSLEEIPSEYFKTPHYESNLNKTAIKEMLLNGEAVPGVTLEDRVSVIIK